MSRIEGPSGAGNTPTPDANKGTTPPKQGEFERVLDRRDEKSSQDGGSGGSSSGGGNTGGGAAGGSGGPAQPHDNTRLARTGRDGGGTGQGGGGEGQQDSGRLSKPGAEPGASNLSTTPGASTPPRATRPMPAGSVVLGGPSPSQKLFDALAAGSTANTGAKTAPAAENVPPPPHTLGLAGEGNGALAPAGAAHLGAIESAKREAKETIDPGMGALGVEGGHPPLVVAMPSPDGPVPPAVDANAIRALAEKVATAMDLHQAANRPELSIGLDLGALGAGNVTIQRGADGVSISFSLATPEGAAFLAERLPQLEKALGDRGIAVSHLDAPPPTTDTPKATGSDAKGNQSGGENPRDRRGDGGQDDGRSRGRFEIAGEDEG